MSNNIRLRFPPSPTGFLHIGSLRTVLFNYIIAKKLNGKLILRIEDTDQKREVAGAVEGLLDIMDWCGIKFDEGPHVGGDFGPYIQSERLDIYKKHIEDLVFNNKAYYCFCSVERLQKMREEQQAQKKAPKYDRRCRDLPDEIVKSKIKTGEKYVVRQKMPLAGEVKVNDELRGEIKFLAEDLEDQVLLKRDGFPTYQLANVVDDHLMEISHVLRGEEWIPSFPKNILLYRDFGWQPPLFVHLALSLNKDGGKLSKRQGDVAVEDYRRKGYLPEALINFSVLQGWHPKDDNEILSLDEVIEKFEIKDMKTHGAIFDLGKLDYFNGYYIRQKSLDELSELCRPFLEENLKLAKKEHKKTSKFTQKIVKLEQERLKKLSEIEDLTKFFFLEPEELNYEKSLLIWKNLTNIEVKTYLEKVYVNLQAISEENWTNNSIETLLIAYIKKENEKVGNFLWPMRVALSGEKASPSPFDIADVLGKEETLERIKRAIKKLQQID